MEDRNMSQLTFIGKRLMHPLHCKFKSIHMLNVWFSLSLPHTHSSLIHSLVPSTVFPKCCKCPSYHASCHRCNCTPSLFSTGFNRKRPSNAVALCSQCFCWLGWSSGLSDPRPAVEVGGPAGAPIPRPFFLTLCNGSQFAFLLWTEL